MARVSWFPLAVVLATVHPFAATCSAQPLAQGCWYDCPGTTLDGAPGQLAVGPTGDVFVQHGDSQWVRYDGVGNCGPSWRARQVPSFPYLAWTGSATDPAGNLYAAERTYGTIHKWSREGDSLRVWGGYGSTAGKFYYLMGLATDNAGFVYAGDYQLSRVQKFDSDGNFISEWSAGGSVVALAVDDSDFVFVGRPTEVRKYSSTGTLIAVLGGFNAIAGVSCDHLAHLFVWDWGRQVVRVYTSSGVFLEEWDATGWGVQAWDTGNNLYVSFVTPENSVCKYGPGPVPARTTSWGRVKTFYR
jgi:tripartite motif-containing protein 71